MVGDYQWDPFDGLVLLWVWLQCFCSGDHLSELLVHGLLLVTSGQEIVFQFCHSFPEILCPGANPSKSQALAVWDGICTVPWVAALWGQVLVGVCGLAVQIRVYVTIINDDFGV